MLNDGILKSNHGPFSEYLAVLNPFIVGGIISWPIYWCYRGFQWPKVKGKECLPLYIRKTFFQAKLLGLTFIAGGLVALTITKMNKYKLTEAEKKEIVKIAK